MWNEYLGYILICLFNFGIGFRVGVYVRLLFLCKVSIYFKRVLYDRIVCFIEY